MNKKVTFFVCLLITLFCTPIFGQEQDKIKTVVIDAGHGGHDPGCLGSKSREKDVVLDVALKTGKLINKHCPDVKVIYTRSTDVFVELYRRAQIANDNKANLFISIHCNAAQNKSAHGIETFVMGVEKNEASMEIAKRENSVILLEKNYENNYDGFDPNSDEATVVFSLYSSAYLKNSAKFAAKVQNNLIKSTKLTDRQVRQAGYWVLYKVAMPSILVELGFLSNPQEEAFLIQEKNKNMMAASICNAFIEYKNGIEGNNIPLISQNTTPPKESTHPKTTEKKQETKQNTTTPKEEITKNDVKDNKTNNNTPTPNENKTNNTEQTQTSTDNSNRITDIRFRVQFFATKENLNTNDPKFSGLKDVKKYFENNIWKYTAGNTATYEEISPILKEVKAKFPDAFIIAFKNDKKISVSEARKWQNNIKN